MSVSLQVKVIQQAYRDSNWRATTKVILKKHAQIVVKDREREEQKQQYLASDEFRMTRLGKLQLLLDAKLNAEEAVEEAEEQRNLDERYE